MAGLIDIHYGVACPAFIYYADYRLIRFFTPADYNYFHPSVLRHPLYSIVRRDWSVGTVSNSRESRRGDFYFCLQVSENISRPRNGKLPIGGELRCVDGSAVRMTFYTNVIWQPLYKLTDLT